MEFLGAWEGTGLLGTTLFQPCHSSKVAALTRSKAQGSPGLPLLPRRPDFRSPKHGGFWTPPNAEDGRCRTMAVGGRGQRQVPRPGSPSSFPFRQARPSKE